MTNRIGQPSRGRAHRAVFFAVFALLSLCLPGLASAQWVTNGTSTTTSNNVGVGTTAPLTKLHVRDADATSDNEVFVETTSGSYGPSIRLRSSIPGQAANFLLTATAAGNVGGAGAFRIYDYIGDATRLFIAPTTGNVGINTTAPLAKLHVEGSSTYGTSGVFAAVYAKGTADYPMALMLDGAGTSDSIARLRALNNGQTKWQVNFGDDLIFYNWTNAFNDRLALKSNGDVGIGTAAPAAKLQVSGAGGYNIPGAAEFRLQNTVWGGSFAQHVGDNGLWQLTDTTTGATKFAVAPGGDGAIRFYNGAGAVVFKGTGRVEVGGDFNTVGKITGGTIEARYQDVAEWVPSTQKLAAGTVVVLDKAASNHVLASSRAYDTKVAGVVSLQPGISLGESGEGKLLVATTGRVRIKVDATRGAIEVGDLLVTSGVEGLAMKSQPVDLGGVSIHRPGTIIGKALEPLAGGTGEILVLLSLQ